MTIHKIHCHQSDFANAIVKSYLPNHATPANPVPAWIARCTLMASPFGTGRIVARTIMWAESLRLSAPAARL